jgi:hypothetical protein
MGKKRNNAQEDSDSEVLEDVMAWGNSKANYYKNSED